MSVKVLALVDVKKPFVVKGATILSAFDVLENLDYIPDLQSDLFLDQMYLRDGEGLSEDDIENEIDEFNLTDYVFSFGINGFEALDPDYADYMHGYPITRPALILEEGHDLEEGEKICISCGSMDYNFTVISEEYALLDTTINYVDDWEYINDSLSNPEFAFDDVSTSYEGSKIEARVNAWFEKEIKPNMNSRYIANQ